MSRRIMWFLLPRDLDAVRSDSSNDRDHIPVYINPQSIDIKENKLINHTLTKGGYMVQYWGEELPIISVNGTTGSGGIEAVNILRDIYRYEQLAMKNVLLQRAEQFAASSSEALADTSSVTTLSGLVSATDGFFQDAASSLADGFNSAVEGFTNAYNGVTENKKVKLPPSTAAFAVSMDIFFQGVKYRGFFKDFSVQESAERPGLFDYSFTFMVTRKTGTRLNFMPWHRKPTTLGGFPKTASIPIEGAATNELSFPTTADYGSSTEQIISDRKSSDFNQTQEGEKEVNAQPKSRRSMF